MARVHANNYSTLINGAINNVTTSIVVDSVTGLPSLGSNTINLTLDDGAGNVEIVKVTSISTLTLTVVRGQEGTVAQSWADNTVIEARATRDSIDTKQDTLSGLSVSSATVATGDKVLIQDVSDSDNLKYVTSQSIADLSLTFKTISVSGQSDVVADSATDTLTFAAGSGMTITTNASTDTITFAASGGGGSQTPWTSNIDNAGYKIINASTSSGVTFDGDGNGIHLLGSYTELVPNSSGTAPVLRFYENDANGTSYIGLKAPASLSGNYTHTFPADYGTNNQALTTNGSGTLSWTTIDKTFISLGNVENTALSTWAGTTNITTLGTISTGTWSGTAIGVTKGGTGLTSTTANQLLYSSATSTIAGLATANNGMLVTDGSGVPSISSTPPSAVLNNIPGRLKSFQIFTSGSSATYTKPSGITSILVELVGGGGGGGSAQGGASSFAAGAGGGAGGYARLWVASASSTYTYTVGSGGAGGASGLNNGSAGGTTSFSASSLQATGGSGGQAANNTVTVTAAAFWAGGAGGVGSNGDINSAGAPGDKGIAALGGLASGFGGASHFGGGAASVANATGAGNAASSKGSGGSGGSATSSSFAGGDGAAGLIIVWEFS